MPAFPGGPVPALRQPYISRRCFSNRTGMPHHLHPPQGSWAAGLSKSLVLQGLSLPPAPSFSPQASWVRGPAGPQGSDPFPTPAPGGVRACHSPVCHQRAGQHEEGEQARQNQGRDVANWKVEREQSGRSGPGSLLGDPELLPGWYLGGSYPCPTPHSERRPLVTSPVLRSSIS